MAEISIGEAIGEGFRLIRRRPGAVCAWGLVQVAVAAAGFALLAPLMASTVLPAFRHGMGGGPPSPPDLAAMARMQSISFLTNLLTLFSTTVVYCAAFRAVLHPDRGRYAYLRVGAPELLLCLLVVGGYVAMLIGMVVAAIPVVIVVFILTAAHAGAVAAPLVLVAILAAAAVAIYLLARLSLVGPMMVDDGRFHLVDAWALTRGKAAQLFGLALLVLVVLIAAELVVALVLAAVGLGVAASLGGGLKALPAFFQQPPSVVLAHLGPFLAALAVIWIPLTGCAAAIGAGPWARAYRDLRPARDIAETFS